MRAIFLTILALSGFALNSILCRLALGSESIDPVAFTAIRLISGAIALYFISNLFRNKEAEKSNGNWLSAFLLFSYAICFSFAYMGLTTGTGALILFGSVQLTMIIAALIKGERPGILAWTGLILAFAGLIYLVLPGIASPPPFNFLLMMLAGISWGFYTLRGRGSQNPLEETAGIFLRSIPIMLLASLPFIFQIHMSPQGIFFAVLSGVFASGMGYAIWYSALKYHSAARAAILQLAVPVLAAIGGVILLSEIFTIHLLASGGMILGGIALSLLGKDKAKQELPGGDK